MKKTEFVTFRTDQLTKESLESIAAERKWSISQLSEEIIKDFVQRHAVETGTIDMDAQKI